MEERLTMYEESLYAQFAAMEEAIARMNSQTGFLSSLLNPSADSNS
jgi:flagellar capping protein FliD